MALQIAEYISDKVADVTRAANVDALAALFTYTTTDGVTSRPLGEFPVNDPQALRGPRPDTSLGEAGSYSSRDTQWGWSPVGGGFDPYNLTPNALIMTGGIGQVTVIT